MQKTDEVVPLVCQCWQGGEPPPAEARALAVCASGASSPTAGALKASAPA